MILFIVDVRLLNFGESGSEDIFNRVDKKYYRIFFKAMLGNK